MTEIKERVVTEFEIADKATSSLGGMQSAFHGVGNTIESTMGKMFSLQSAIAGVVAGLGIHKIIEIGETAEATKTQLAGFFQVQHMVGSFNEGLEVADRTMGKLNRAAAVLSGTTQEYTGTFLQAFSNVRAASGGSIEDVYKFTNKMTAVGKAFKLESSEIGRQLTALLAPGHGMAGMHNVLFLRMLSSMQQLKGHAHLTAAEFNKMTQKDRFELLTKTVGQFDDMIKETSKSWEAQSGTLKSNLRMITKLATANVFEALKDGLGHLNAMFLDSNGNLTEFSNHIIHVASSIGNVFIHGVERALEALKRLSQSPAFLMIKEFMGHMVSGIKGALGGLVHAGGAGAGAGVAAAGMLPVMALLSKIPLFGSLIPGIGPLGMVVIPILVSAFQTLGKNTTALTAIFDGVKRVAGAVVGIFEGLAPVLQTAGELLGNLAIGILPPLLDALGSLAEIANGVLGPALRGLAGDLSYFAQILGKSEAEKKQDEWEKWNSEARANPNYREMTYEETVAYATNGGSFMDKLAYEVMERGKVALGMSSQLEGGNRPLEYMGTTDTNTYEPFTDQHATSIALANATREFTKVAAKTDTPAARGGGGRAVQDFRYSRFEIQQKFAEGYDPDRIAVAFAKDVGRIGEMRLQSAHEPPYSTH